MICYFVRYDEYNNKTYYLINQMMGMGTKRYDRILEIQWTNEIILRRTNEKYICNDYTLYDVEY